MAIALGGTPEVRMLARRAVPWSRDTMLRVSRQNDPLPLPAAPARVVGIDDFAWRRGHSYGSTVVDIERREVIDLLPDRQRDTVIAWLRQNPQVQIICRDRGPGYGAAASEAARRRGRWPTADTSSAAFLAACRACTERLQWDSAQSRKALNRQITDLAGRGMPIKAVARTTGVSRQTIRKVLRGKRHDTFRSRQSIARCLVSGA